MTTQQDWNRVRNSDRKRLADARDAVVSVYDQLPPGDDYSDLERAETLIVGVLNAWPEREEA